MAGWGLATAGTHIDLVATSVAIASLAVAIGSGVLTWYLWRRSGPKIVVTHRGWYGGVQVTNSGRMPVVIWEVGMYVLPHDSGSYSSTAQVVLYPDKGDYPVTIPPFGAAIFPRDGRERTPDGSKITWWAVDYAYAVRADGRRYIDDRRPRPELPPRFPRS